MKGVLRENFLRVFREVENVRNTFGVMDVGESEILEEVQNSCRLDLRKPQLQSSRSFGFLSAAQPFSLTLVSCLMLHYIS